MTSFAIVPAAGRSLRMGKPKLLLPWANHTLVEHVLAAWKKSAVDHCLVIVHPDDAQLADACRRSGVDVVIPAVAPPEMKDSVEAGLSFVAQHYAPRPEDLWLLAPADMPRLTSEIIDTLLAAAQRASGQIIEPQFRGQHGHPVVFPWSLAAEVSRLGPGEGINALVHRFGAQYVECSQAAILEDLNTPEDYDRLRGQSDAD